MVPIKPHSVTVYPVGQEVLRDLTLANPSKGTPTVVQCYLERWTQSEFYNEYGVTLLMPALIQCEIVDRTAFQPDAEITFGSEVYKVVGIAALRDAGNDADHVDVMLERKLFGLP